MTNYIVSLLCAIVACVYAEYTTPKQYESCVTPAKTPGHCIPFRDCSELIRVFKTHPSSLTDAYLGNAHCGLQGVEEKVCCSLEGNDFDLVFAPDTKTNDDTTWLLPEKDFCGKPADYSHGESLDELYEFPWTALLKFEKHAISVFHCAGSLISDRYVLTTARCLKPRYLPIDGELVGVRLGEYNLNKEIDCAGTPRYRTCSEKAIDVPVVETIAHEDYNPMNNFNDIALLRLEKDVGFTDFVKPICLPIYPDVVNTSFSWSYLTVSGWETSNRSIKRKANFLFLAVHITTL
ncbi:serine protease easter-like isoform X2 [Photinus pyralis]|uniref:CLIP domain-containing serine protease n=1 Tax=Photinus pyralis TaxID=7054 RepID=A0A1Y1NJD1_PHOPY|nr:serine protease easter-like isoform X2 [Photinus pyralis]